MRVRWKIYRKRAISLIRCYVICRINISTVQEPKWQQQIIKLSMQLKSLIEHCTERMHSFLDQSKSSYLVSEPPLELMTPLKLIFKHTLSCNSYTLWGLQSLTFVYMLIKCVLESEWFSWPRGNLQIWAQVNFSDVRLTDRQ